MPSLVSNGRQWPPSPCVEDETESLSREISDPSVIESKEDKSPVCSKGTVDQYPVLLTVDIPEPCSLPPDSCDSLAGSSVASESSNESNGPTTPSTERKIEATAGSSSAEAMASVRKMSDMRYMELLDNFELRTHEKHASKSSGTRPSPVSKKHASFVPPHQPPPPHPPPVHMPIPYITEIVPQNVNKAPEQKGNQSTSRHKPAGSGSFSDPEALRRSRPRLNRNVSEGDGSLYTFEKRNPPVECHSDEEVLSSCHGTRSIMSRGSKASDGTTKKKKKVNFRLPDDFGDERPTSSVSQPSPKLPQQQYYQVESEKRHRSPVSSKRHGSRSVSRSRHEYSVSPGRIIRTNNSRRNDSPPSRSSSPRKSSSSSSSSRRQSSVQPRQKLPSPSRDTSPRRSEELCLRRRRSPSPVVDEYGYRAPLDCSPTRHRSASKSPPLPPPTGWEMVPYADGGRDSEVIPHEQEMVPYQHMPRHRNKMLPAPELVRSRMCAPPSSNPSLAPCPRSIPMTGYHDWYTIIGLTHLDICPSCMHQIGGSRFRDLFVPSIPKPRDARVRCSFSQPWARLAWVQTMKLQLNHLELLYQVTRPPPGTRPCPGRAPSVQPWYRLTDPESGRMLSDFGACSACMRNLQVLIPAMRGAFRPGPMLQERICDLRTDSPRFVQYLDLLDIAATRSRYDESGYLDMRDFIRYAKRKSTLYDCPRDHLVAGTWHYMPEFPEFTICEDCYDDVVWPLSDSPLANLITPDPELLPPGCGKEATCQLYSPRMRTILREAVRYNDYAYLEAEILRRYSAENTFRKRKKLLLEDVARGYDRDSLLRRNADEWKRYE